MKLASTGQVLTQSLAPACPFAFALPLPWGDSKCQKQEEEGVVSGKKTTHERRSTRREKEERRKIGFSATPTRTWRRATFVGSGSRDRS